MALVNIEQSLARHLPTNFLRDLFPRGMRRLAEMGLFRKPAIVDTIYGFRMMADRLDAVKWYVYYFRQFEPQISMAWTRLLQPGDAVVDIGGNVGYHALLAASCVGPTGKVVTVEPSMHIFPQLERNIGLNGYKHITAMRKAVSNAPGTATLYYAGDNIQGNSSIFKSGDGEPTETVECVTVGQIAEVIDLKSVKIFKIDVEGAEPLVLESLFASLDQLRANTVIFVEISPSNTNRAEQMLAPFFEAGFQARLIPNEYETAFYRDTKEVTLRPLAITDGVIHDVILTRDPANFDMIEGKI